MKKDDHQKPIISIIVARSKNKVIGKDNKLLWHFKEDLNYFKEKTKGKIVLMGSNTFKSINSIPLKDRLNFVLSSKYKDNIVSIQSNDPFTLLFYINSSDFKDDFQGFLEFLNKLFLVSGLEVFIIGGQKVYEQFLPYINKIYLTEIDLEVNGDTFFNFDEKEFTLIEKEDKICINKLTNQETKLSFQVFERIRKN